MIVDTYDTHADTSLVLATHDDALVLTVSSKWARLHVAKYPNVWTEELREYVLAVGPAIVNMPVIRIACADDSYLASLVADVKRALCGAENSPGLVAADDRLAAHLYRFIHAARMGKVIDGGVISVSEFTYIFKDVAKLVCADTTDKEIYDLLNDMRCACAPDVVLTGDATDKVIQWRDDLRRAKSAS